MTEYFSEYTITYLIIPVLIFIARLTDVTIGTMRLIFVSKGYKLAAPILGFFEVIIWLLAISQIMQHLDNWVCYIAYGGGFATGNYVGIILEEKLSIGNVIIRVFPKTEIHNLVSDLRSHKFAVSTVEIEGKEGKRMMLFSILKRKSVNKYLGLVNFHNPKAFYAVEDIKAVSEIDIDIIRNTKLSTWRRIRKGK